MRPGREAGRADVADHLALVDVLAGRDGDARLVAVRRRDAAAVVDDHEVPEPVEPTGVDDRSGGRGADGRARTGGDVEPVVEAPPAGAEAARDRPGDRPHESA